MESGEYHSRRGGRLRQKAGNSAKPGVNGDIPAAGANGLHESKDYRGKAQQQNQQLHRIRDSLEKARNRYQLLYDYAPSGYFTLDRRGRITSTNLTFCSLMHRQRGGSVGKPFSSCLAPASQEAYQRLLAAGRNDQAEIQFRRDDGSVFWAWVSLEPILDDKAQPLEYWGTLVDISDRKVAEDELRTSRQQLKRIINASNDGFWEWDVPSGQVIVSTRWRRIAGLPPGQGPVPLEDIRHLIHPDDQPRVQAVLDTILADGSNGDHFELEYRYRRPDGREVWAFCRATVTQRDADGRALQVSGVISDITRRKHALIALEALNATLEHRVEQRTEELRQSIEDLQTEIARRELAERTLRDRSGHLEQLNLEFERRSGQLSHLASQLTLAEQRERRHLAVLLHDHLQQLLVGARLGLEVLSRRLTDRDLASLKHVGKLLDEAVGAARSLTVELSPPILHEAGLAAGLKWLASWIKDKHALDVDIRIGTDATTEREDVRILLFQSVRELLFNVVKHAGVSRARVTLERGDKSHLRVIVADDGPGFDPDSAMKDGAATSGFGLFSIHERLTSLGGDFKIHSAPGRGCRAVLTVPLDNPRKTEGEQDELFAETDVLSD